MPKVKIVPHLRNQFRMPAECVAAGTTLAEVVADLERQFPGVRSYLLDDQGSLRPHVNLFIGNKWVRDRATLGDAVGAHEEVHVFQALSGG